MNKNELINNLNAINSYTCLKNSIANKRVLLLNNDNIEAVPPPGNSLVNFFDVLITSNFNILNNYPVDVFILLDRTPYQNNVLKLDYFGNKKDVIFVINKEFAATLRAAKYNLVDNFICTYSFISDKDDLRIAQEVCTNNNFSMDREQLEKYMGLSGKYGMRLNLLNKNRKPFLYYI